MDSGVQDNGGHARLGRDVQARIGHKLRSLYDDVVKEGVPPRFSELLKKLENNEFGTLDISSKATISSGQPDGTLEEDTNG